MEHALSVLDRLRAEIRQHQTSNSITQEVLPFGISELDNCLPEKGIKLGSYHEVAGEAAATLFIAGILARVPGPVIWCIRHQDLFAPALAQAGLDMDRIIFVETLNEQTLLACFEEGLRQRDIAGVVGEISKLSMTASRRLQLAAESSGAIGIGLWRWRKQGNVTAAHTSWRVTERPSAPLPVQGVGRGRWNLELLRCRGGEPASLIVEACNETGYISLSSTSSNRSSTQETGLRIAS